VRRNISTRERPSRVEPRPLGSRYGLRAKGGHTRQSAFHPQSHCGFPKEEKCRSPRVVGHSPKNGRARGGCPRRTEELAPTRSLVGVMKTARPVGTERISHPENKSTGASRTLATTLSWCAGLTELSVASTRAPKCNRSVKLPSALEASGCLCVKGWHQTGFESRRVLRDIFSGRLKEGNESPGSVFGPRSQ